LKYPPDFRNFDYVDPNAPKGGTFSQIGPSIIFNQNFLTFNSLNSFILRGDAAQGMELTFASLMTRAIDESDALYGLAARGVRIAPDGLTYRFLLRREARFHDGSSLTAHDVAYSLKILKEQGHPQITIMSRDMIDAQARRPQRRGSVQKARATSRCSARCRSYRVLTMRPVRSRSRRSTFRWGRAPTGSANSRAAAGSPMTVSRIGGAPSCRSRSDSIISIACGSNTIATATSGLKDSPAKPTCSARSLPHARGRPVMTSRRSEKGA
jgi:hypothetical protein